MAHAIYGYPGACKNIHGHSYELHVTVSPAEREKDYIPAPGFILDFRELKKLVISTVIETLDHKLVLSRDYLVENPDIYSQENLFILGCGPVPPNPAELLLDPKMEELFIWVKANFEVILVDTAPVGMVSDAMTLSKFADSTLYLVRQGHTFKKQIALIDEFYVGNKLPKISIVINDVKIKAGYGYYGYGRYGYGYGYGYGSYYEEEKPPPNFFEKLLSGFDVRKTFRGSKRK